MGGIFSGHLDLTSILLIQHHYDMVVSTPAAYSLDCERWQRLDGSIQMSEQVVPVKASGFRKFGMARGKWSVEQEFSLP